MGRAAREEFQRQQQLMKQGFEIYQDYTKQGFKAKQDRDARMAEIEQQKAETEIQRNNFRKMRDAAEEPEKEAIQAHKKAWEGNQSRS